MENGQDIAVSLEGSNEAVDDLGRQLGYSNGKVASLIASALGDFARKITETAPIHGFILTGGDISKAVCEQLGSYGMRLVKEVEPGIPVGRLLGAVEVAVVTKAGAFGSDTVFRTARNILKGEM